MTEQDLLLAGGTASVALAITLADLLFSLWRHMRTARRASMGSARGETASEDPSSAARREALRRRLAAIQAASSEQ